MKTEYTESDHKIVGKTVCDMISHTRMTKEPSFFYDKSIDMIVIVRHATSEEREDLLEMDREKFDDMN